MKTARFLSGVVSFLALGNLIFSFTVSAAVAPDLAVPSGLSLAQVKITGTEYILLQNNTGADIPASDLSNYWLFAFNSSTPTSSGVSSSSQQLPAAILPNGQTLLISSTGGSTCGASVTDNLSLSLTDSTGYLEVVHQNMVGGVLTPTVNDAVSWTSSASPAAGANIVTPTSTSAKPAFASYRYLASPLTFWWQPANIDATNPCQLDVAGDSPASPDSSAILLLPSSPPPAKIISLVSTESIGGIPASDNGLKSPVINELLPNPSTSDKGEFIEIYNPNPADFDLENFILQTGTTTLHKYTFPSGVILEPLSFTAFSLTGTTLSLSNNGGQAELLDPLGNIISMSDPYASAKAGQSWALANGKWYWTTSPTPSAENLINQASSAGSSTVSGPQVLGASGGASGTGFASSSTNQATPLHPAALAGVGIVAVGYALYEYKTDLANRLHQLRRYREARAAARPELSGRGSAGAAGRLGRWQNNLRAWLGRRLKK